MTLSRIPFHNQTPAHATIIFMKAAINYTQFYLSCGKSQTICQTLKRFEEIYSKDGQIRINRNLIVNPSFIEAYCKYTQTIFLSTGQELIVSRTKRKVMRGWEETRTTVVQH